MVVLFSFSIEVLAVRDELMCSESGVCLTDREWIGVVVSRRAVDVVAELEGRLAEVLVEVGQSVEEGDVLAEIKSEQISYDFKMALAQQRSANSQIEKSLNEVEKYKNQLHRREKISGIISGEEISTVQANIDSARADVGVAKAELESVVAELESLKWKMSKTKILSPMSGSISLRYIDSGSQLKLGDQVFRLVSTDELFVRFAVPESHIYDLKKGARINVNLEHTASSVGGVVNHISSEIDMASQMVFVEAKIENFDFLPPIGTPVFVSLQESDPLNTEGLDYE